MLTFLSTLTFRRSGFYDLRYNFRYPTNIAIKLDTYSQVLPERGGRIVAMKSA